MDESLFKKAASFMLERKPWLVLTGAGISTESGIPDFRSPGSGLWDKYDPMAVVTFPINGELVSEVITRGYQFPESKIVVNDIDESRVVLDANGTLVSLQLEER